MKKIYLLPVLFFVLNAFVGAQDVIIRDNGDTINCSVTKIDSNRIYFSFIKNGNLLNTYLNKSQIKDYHVPLLPTDPRRLKYEKKIRNNKVWSVLGGTAFVAGGTLAIIGWSQLNEDGAEFESSPGSTTVTAEEGEGRGMDKFGIGLPLCVAGGVMCLISTHKVIKYKKKLNYLYRVSINGAFGQKYSNFSICYRF